MPDEQRRCTASIAFQSRIFICDLDQGHEGDHKAMGRLAVENQGWTLSWTNGLSPVPFPASGRIE